ncbi:protein TASOR 2-like [Rhincodon typus]|uniref:protein TASOR 2-like n=1 Tax=Rhincodon typus TaxID=259920 RepID=UPI002030F880|nr:protein TASOR 2-like [Rhincodon typus]
MAWIKQLFLLWSIFQAALAFKGNCGKPDFKVKNIDLSEIMDAHFEVGHRLRLKCQSGYKRKAGTSNLIRCQNNSKQVKWSEPNLECITTPVEPRSVHPAISAATPGSLSDHYTASTMDIKITSGTKYQGHKLYLPFHCILPFDNRPSSSNEQPFKLFYLLIILLIFQECLKNEGHVEIGLLDLSVTQPHHCGKVLIIIRNEDISGHLHQIPHLLALKQMPCVQFAGVDSAEDIKDQTFQELFSSGGFVVSDGTVLNNVTPECLQQISSVLEQLNAQHNWKWMIHFKELKKLKETAREDNTAKRKVSLLTRKIAANLVEVLPFHTCDSRSREKPDYLSCLMKLQVQKISSRFAVFLTGKLENRDLFAQSGILVTDVNSFTKGLRMLTTSTQDTLDTENAHVTEGGHYSEIQLEPPYGKNKVNQNLQMPSSLF